MSLLDLAAKLLQAGAQRGTALRDDDLLLLRAAASALVILQSNLKPSHLGCANASCASGVALQELNHSEMQNKNPGPSVTRIPDKLMPSRREVKNDV